VSLGSCHDKILTAAGATRNIAITIFSAAQGSAAALASLFSVRNLAEIMLVPKVGVLPFVPLSIILLAVYLVVSLCLFEIRMARIKYPSARKWRPWPLLRLTIGFDIARFVGATWFLRNAHWWVGTAFLLILTIAYWRGKTSVNALEIQRAGSLVVIAGLASLMLGLWEAKKTRQDWRSIIERVKGAPQKEKMQDHMADQIEAAQLWAGTWSAVVSAIGTVIWGYGDQLVACVHTPIIDAFFYDKTVGCYVPNLN
jgi:hypothetical protein